MIEDTETLRVRVAELEAELEQKRDWLMDRTKKINRYRQVLEMILTSSPDTIAHNLAKSGLTEEG
jgi:NADH:ubiquinone oxidoreductase subunit F (NADH-binding)